MNAPFVLPTEELNAKFIAEAKAKGFVNLKGHRTVGGMGHPCITPCLLKALKSLLNLWVNLNLKINNLNWRKQKCIIY